MNKDINWEAKSKEQGKKIVKLKRTVAELLKAGDDFASSASEFEVERWKELSRRIKAEIK